MEKEELKEVLRERQGYLKSGSKTLAKKFGVTRAVAKQAALEVNLELKGEKHDVDYTEFLEWKASKAKGPKAPAKRLPKPYTGGDKDNVLTIGDLHEPFCLDGYLEFCREQQETYNCGTVVFIGDIIDNHYSSYHETETTLYGADEELERAIGKVANWYKVFPKADVCIGNHDRMAFRKVKTGGVSARWVREYSEVLGTPGWNFIEEVIYNGVNYNHGEGGTAKTKMKNESMSQVQGHLHSQAYIEFSVGTNHRIFGMQVGCGIDRHSHAFSYGKNYKKPVISCGIILNKGTLPILIPMMLGDLDKT